MGKENLELAVARSVANLGFKKSRKSRKAKVLLK